MKFSHQNLSQSNQNACPRLRSDLEPVHYFYQHGKKYYGFIDPFELSDEHIAMPEDLFYTMQYMDGNHSFTAIQKLYLKKFSHPLLEKRLVQLLNRLDALYLLENETARLQLQQIRQLYKNEKTRNMRYAGTAYPQEATEFSDLWKKYPVEKLPVSQQNKVTALISPHIDIQMGAETYAAAYNALPQAELYIILGISHLAMHNPFALTLKHFETPNGLLQTDQNFVQQLASQCETDFFFDEIFHKSEHSIEFQTACLGHFAHAPFHIVPILCAFSYAHNRQTETKIIEFVNALKAIIEHDDRRICIIAGVDLAHVGPLYGDASSPDAYFLDQVEKSDRQFLNIAAQGDAQGFTEMMRQTHNAFHICGFAAIYTLLQLLPGRKGDLLHYNNAIMDKERSTVTFAAMLFP